MVTPEQHSQIIEELNGSKESGFDLRMLAMRFLDGLPLYDWSGIYRLEGDTLVLDAYVGAHTDHDRIPVGRGVCGAAVADNETKNIADVREIENYLACSLETRSELVVLIRDGESILGQIDIDSHTVGAFDDSDERLLDEVGQILSRRW